MTLGPLVMPLNVLLGEVRAVLTPQPVTLVTLPPELRRDWVAADGRARVQVFPKGDSNDNAVLKTFAAAVRRVAPDASGAPISVQEAGGTISGAFITAGLLSLVAICALLILALRSVTETLFTLAPMLFLVPAVMTFIVIPYGSSVSILGRTIDLRVTRIDVGLLYLLALGSLGVYGIALAGWSSNNKYSFIGGLRSSAKFVSYEIPMGLSILGVVLMTGSLNLERMIENQAEAGWNILFQPLAFLIFMASAFAECNRLQKNIPAGLGLILDHSL